MKKSFVSDDLTYNILFAVSCGDYKTLRELPRIENLDDHERVEAIVRNIIIKNKDSDLMRSYPIKYRQALLDNVNNTEVFGFLLEVLFGKNSKFLVDVPSYVFEKAPRKALELLVEYNNHPYFEDLSDQGKLDYIDILKETEMQPHVAIDIFEHILNEHPEESDKFIKGNKYIEKLSDFGYYLPKRKRKETDTELIYRTINKIKKNKFC